VTAQSSVNTSRSARNHSFIVDLLKTKFCYICPNPLYPHSALSIETRISSELHCRFQPNFVQRYFRHRHCQQLVVIWWHVSATLFFPPQHYFKKYCVVASLSQHIIFSKNNVFQIVEIAGRSQTRKALFGREQWCSYNYGVDLFVTYSLATLASAGV